MDTEINQSGSGKAGVLNQGTRDDCGSQHSSVSRSHSISKSANTLSQDATPTSEEAPKPKKRTPPPPPNISGGSRKVSGNREAKKKERKSYYVDSARGADRQRGRGFVSAPRRRGGRKERLEARRSHSYRYSNGPHGRRSFSYPGPSSVGVQNSPRGDDETEEFFTKLGMWNEINDKFQRSAKKYFSEKQHEAKEVAELRERNSLLVEKIAKLEETVEKKCEAEKKLEKVNAQLNLRISEKEKMIKELKNELEKSKATTVKVVRERDELLLANSSLNDDLGKAKREILFLEQEQESAKKEIESRAAAQTNLIAELETLKVERDSKIFEINKEKLSLEDNLKRKTDECEYRKVNHNRLKQMAHYELQKIKNKMKNEIAKISEIQKTIIPPNPNRGTEPQDQIGPPPQPKPSSSNTNGEKEKEKSPSTSTSGPMNSSQTIAQGQCNEEANQICNAGGSTLPSIGAE